MAHAGHFGKHYTVFGMMPGFKIWLPSGCFATNTWSDRTMYLSRLSPQPGQGGWIKSAAPRAGYA
jgi:hypothetical protein